VTDPKAIVSAADLSADGVLKLSLGKKKHLLIKPV
jgi:tyrosyl-tRNA synthetase